MDDYYEKMREHLDRHEQSRIRGLRSHDVVAQHYSESELLQLVHELRERPLAWESAFRLASFIHERQQDRIPSQLRDLAANALADYVSPSTERPDISAVEIFIAWGVNRADHRSICLSLLRHSNSSVRTVALSYAGLFLQPPDFSMLFEFQYDPYISEIAMCGPLRYILRDHALHVLERLTNFPGAAGGDCFEEKLDGRVSYRSWSPFLNWYESHRR